MASPPTTPLRIGEALEGARTRRGLGLEEAAERTKIRAKYLRALEAEDWEKLPSTAYAKGFLRTYGRLLGLDADALVDEYRRRVEVGIEPEHLLPFGDPVLDERRRPPGLERQRRWPGPLAAALAVAVLAAALVLVIAGELGNEAHKRHHPRHGAGRRHHRHQRPAAASTGPLTLRLRAIDGVQVCLVSAGQPLIDSQALSPGAEAGPFEGRRLRLDLDSFGGGALRLRLNGHGHKVHARGRASYVIAGNQVTKTSYRGPRCP
jgi:transcriptional regulator with XRE-family HTH domain